MLPSGLHESDSGERPCVRPALGQVVGGKYRLDAVLGEGGTSTVYAATNEATRKAVAIKWLHPELADPEQCERLLREARSISAINHPNVVNVFDIGRHQGAVFLVMERLHGETLSELLEREGVPPAADFIALMLPALSGVEAAHRAGVVHRDIKPDNIFICRDEHGERREPKVLDFGTAKQTNDRLVGGEELTRAGVVFGTPHYMAPEQMRDARASTARSDVYALGVIFYRVFSGAFPYDGDSLVELARRLGEGAPVPLQQRCPQLDGRLCSIIMRAIELDPQRRYPTVASLAAALVPHAFRPRAPKPSAAEPVVSGQRVRPPPPPRIKTVPPPPARARRSALDGTTLRLELIDLFDKHESRATHASFGAPRVAPPPLPGLRVSEPPSFDLRTQRGHWALALFVVLLALLAAAGWYRLQAPSAAPPSRPAQPPTPNSSQPAR